MALHHQLCGIALRPRPVGIIVSEPRTFALWAVISCGALAFFARRWQMSLGRKGRPGPAGPWASLAASTSLRPSPG